MSEALTEFRLPAGTVITVDLPETDGKKVEMMITLAGDAVLTAHPVMRGGSVSATDTSYHAEPDVLDYVGFAVDGRASQFMVHQVALSD